MPDSGGYASQPVRANSPTNSDSITSTAPATVIQKLKLLRNGNAPSRAPICSGTTMFIKPATIGIAQTKLMNTPCEVRLRSQWSGGSITTEPPNDQPH